MKATQKELDAILLNEAHMCKKDLLTKEESVRYLQMLQVEMSNWSHLSCQLYWRAACGGMVKN